jgi:PIN domain nuclease of toxin-antitoxin system
VRVLLDTHIALWAITDSPRLPAAARDLIAAQENMIHVSAATLWEIAVKHALKREGPSSMPVSASEAQAYFASSGYLLVPITAQHAVSVETLPLLHTDPFDRMLAAQALSEPFRLITHDRDVRAYSETFILV